MTLQALHNTRGSKILAAATSVVGGDGVTGDQATSGRASSTRGHSVQGAESGDAEGNHGETEHEHHQLSISTDHHAGGERHHEDDQGLHGDGPIGGGKQHILHSGI